MKEPGFDAQKAFFSTFCAMSCVYALVFFVCVLLFRYWRIYIRSQPASGTNRTGRLVFWLVAVILTAFSGGLLMWIFTGFFVLFGLPS